MPDLRSSGFASPVGRIVSPTARPENPDGALQRAQAGSERIFDLWEVVGSPTKSRRAVVFDSDRRLSYCNWNAGVSWRLVRCHGAPPMLTFEHMDVKLWQSKRRDSVLAALDAVI